MCNMCRVEEAFKEASQGMNRTVDTIALKKLQAKIYEEFDWFEEAEELLTEVKTLESNETKAGMCTCVHGTIVLGGANHGTCGECGKPTTDE